MTPMKAIRAKCIDCCGTSHEVKLCAVEKCPLYPYRFGKRPKAPNYTREDLNKEKVAPIYAENQKDEIVQG